MKPHLVHVFPAFGGGGPEVRTAAIINRTAGTFRHTVLSLSNIISGQDGLDPQYDVPCLMASQAGIWKLAQRLRALRPDVLLTYGWGGTDALAAARLAGIRRVAHSEDGFLDDEVARQKRHRQLFRRVLFQAAQALIVPSRTLCSIALHKWKVPERRLKYIPNGVDTDKFFPRNGSSRGNLRAEMGLAHEAIVVGTVGALRPEKNQTRLLRAFAQIAAEIPAAHLLIVGDGPLLQPMRCEAVALGIDQRVTFCGHQNDPSRCYQVMDVFALSSDTEQMPLSILEAMSAGLPVLSTDVGDVRLMVAPAGQESIVPAADDAAFSRALRTLLLNHEHRKRLGAFNRKHCVANYSFDRMLSTYVALYQELFAKSRT